MFLARIFISLRLDKRRNEGKINVKEIFVHFILLLFLFFSAEAKERKEITSKSLIFFFSSLLTTYLCSIKTDFRYLTFFVHSFRPSLIRYYWACIMLGNQGLMLHRTSNVIYYAKFLINIFEEVRQNIQLKFIHIHVQHEAERNSIFFLKRIFFLLYFIFSHACKNMMSLMMIEV